MAINAANSKSSTSRTQRSRFWEVDALRGVAIILMVLYHAVFLARMFLLTDANIFSVQWLLVARAASTVFLLLVGVSLVLSYYRARLAGVALQRWRSQRCSKYLQILGWGMLISLVTIFLIPQYPVIFGVLHLIGVGSLLSLPLVAHPRLALGAAALAAALAPLLHTSAATTAHWIWLGRTPLEFQSVDYWPLLPWIGLLWLGITLGHFLFPQGQRRFAILRPPSYIEASLEWLGQRSLLLYLLHTPVIIAFFWILKVIS